MGSDASSPPTGVSHPPYSQIRGWGGEGAGVLLGIVQRRVRSPPPPNSGAGPLSASQVRGGGVPTPLLSAWHPHTNIRVHTPTHPVTSSRYTAALSHILGYINTTAPKAWTGCDLRGLTLWGAGVRLEGLGRTEASPLPCPGAVPNCTHAAVCTIHAHGGELTSAPTHSEVSELIPHQQQGTHTTCRYKATRLLAHLTFYYGNFQTYTQEE